MDLGLSLSGIEIIQSLEIDAQASMTLRANLPHDVLNMDIKDIRVGDQPGSYSRSSLQTSMFTSEQMTGSGQLNMLDQINQVADVRRKLKSTPAVFWNDPGHGWFEANYSDLVLLDIHRIISGYSYRKGDKVYLEEDCDATKYVKAIFGEHPENDPMFPLWKSMIRDEYRENIFIRKLNHYRP